MHRFDDMGHSWDLVALNVMLIHHYQSMVVINGTAAKGEFS